GRLDRAGLLCQLATLDPHPESVPINLLVQVPGTPLHGTAKLDPLELVRTIAAARIMMPGSVVRLSAGRAQMTDELQALCLHAGASSIFLGDRQLTTANPGNDHDRDLLERLDTEVASRKEGEPTGEPVARAARPRSGQEREVQRPPPGGGRPWPERPGRGAARSGKYSGHRPEADAGGRVRRDLSAESLNRPFRGIARAAWLEVTVGGRRGRRRARDRW